MTYSIIQKSQLEGALRLDSVYYQPEYFIDFSKGKWSSIGENFNCQYGLSLAMNDEKIGYPMYKMDDINDSFLLSDGVRFANAAQSEYQSFKLNKNDILFNRVNSEEFVGRTGIFKDNVDGIFASYLIRLTPKTKSRILPDYLNIFLNSKFGLKQIRKYSRRAVNQANVNAEELKQFRIALLNNNEQESIKDLTDKSWAEIENSKSFYRQAEDLLLGELGLKDFEAEETLFSIVNFSDIQKSNRLDAEYFQAKFEELIKKLEEYGVKQLEKVIENVPAKFNPYGEPKKEFRYVELSNIDTSLGIISGSSTVLGKEAASRAKRLLKTDDVIVSSVEGSLEKAALVSKEQEDYLASTGFFQFRSKEILPEVLLVLAKSIVFQYQLQQRCAGTILTAVPHESIKDILIPVLPRETQEKIAELVKKSHAARQKSKELLEESKRKVEEMIEKGGN